MFKKYIILLFFPMLSFSQNITGDTPWETLVTHSETSWNADEGNTTFNWMVNTANQGMYYAYWNTEAQIYLWRITGEKKYINRALQLTQNAINSAVPVQWNSSYLGWKAASTYGSDYPQNGVALWETYYWKCVATYLRILFQSPNFRSQAHGSATLTGTTYQDVYNQQLAFLELHIWNKWHADNITHVNRQNTHMASHWARIGMELFIITGDTKYRDRQRQFDYQGFTTSPFQGANLRDQIHANPSTPSAYRWHATWGNNETNTTSGWQDTYHLSDITAYVILNYENSTYWNITDINAMVSAMKNVYFPSGIGANAYVRIDGSGGFDVAKRVRDGFLLGRFDSALHGRICTQYLSATNTAYDAQYYAIAAFNRFLLDNETPVYPELATGGSVPVTAITFTNTTQTIRDGETLNKAFTFTPAEPTNTNVTFVSSNPAIADNNGNWVSAGTGTYTVTSQDGNFSSVINYTAATTPATGANITPTAITIVNGNTFQLVVEVLPPTATTKTGTWGTSNGSVATVNSSGLVTAVDLGTANITFTSTDGSFVATCAVTVVATSGDKILDRSPILYLSPASIDPAVTVDGNTVSIWEDISGNNHNAIGNGTNALNISDTRQVEFDGNSWFHVVDEAPFDFVMGTDNFTLIAREGDVSSLTAGYLISKVPSSLASAQYGLPYASGNLSGIYAGGTLNGITNTPSGPNRLIIAVFTGATVNVWVDGVQVLTNGSVGTVTTTQRLNIGARTDGSWRMNAGSTIDLVAIIPSALSTPDRESIQDDFIINTVELPVVKPKRFRIGEGRAKTFYINSVKKFFNN